MTRTSAARHRVVIVGSGFGGLFAAKSLGRAPDTIAVTLISRTNYHLFQPLLYQVATGILSEGEIAPATRDVLKKKKNVTVELAEVTGFDLKARHVTAVRVDGVTLYDSNRRCGRRAVVFRARRVHGVGARNETLADALDQRARIFGAFEMAGWRATRRFVGVGSRSLSSVAHRRRIAGQIAELKGH
jgi:NADH dehydrogenase